MTIQDILQEKNMSVYRLAKTSHIPYATVNDIYNGKARLEKCSAETVYRLAHALNVSMEELLAPCFIKRSSFENFKSTVCHRVKELGDINFIIDTLESQDIRTYYNRKWYPESLYLLYSCAFSGGARRRCHKGGSKIGDSGIYAVQHCRERGKKCHLRIVHPSLQGCGRSRVPKMRLLKTNHQKVWMIRTDNVQSLCLSLCRASASLPAQ